MKTKKVVRIPKKCSQCRFRSEEHDWCHLYKKYMCMDYFFGDTKPNGCKAISVTITEHRKRGD